jgi:hypothetical protein
MLSFGGGRDLRDRVSRHRLGLAALASIMLLVPWWAIAQSTRPTDTRPDANPQALIKDYQDRRNRLAANDVPGHYALAEWCLKNKLHEPLLRQAEYVLRLDPGSEQARTLYRYATDQIRTQLSRTRPADGSAPHESSEGEFLTPAQIQRLKWAEFLDADAVVPPIKPLRSRADAAGRTSPNSLTEEFLKVRYEGKVLDEFFDLMSGTPDFTSREDRAYLFRLPPTRQVQLIRKNSVSRFQNRIEIVNDPVVFRQFDRALPLVTSGCGTVACHGGPNAQVWRLRTARTRPELNRYTNFLILNRVRDGNQLLVNRAKPEESLLLQYGLPPVEAVRPHPEPIPVMFPAGRNDVRYRTILGWIQSLRVPESRTGVTLPGYPEPPPPQIGGSPKDKVATKPAGDP